MSIQASHITKLYGTQKALNDVSFTVETGEIAGFIGPNGAGKSTMMKIITGFIPANEGNLLVDEIDGCEDSLSVRKIIGYLPENNPLYEDMYIREYLMYVAGIYRIKQKKARIEEVIRMTGLQAEISKKIGMLSKGFRQRVGLAQAIIHDPRVLILDEPTSGLDPNQIIEIRKLISELGKSKTVLLSTHIMQEVEAICDRVIIINKGQIVADDITSKISVEKDPEMTIIVEFDAAINETELQELKGVIKVAKSGENQYLVQSAAHTDVRKQVFQFAVDQGLSVLNLQQKDKSLEEVFQELTR